MDTFAVKAVMASLLAATLELAVRAAAPIPFAPRAVDLLLSLGLYVAVAGPALMLRSLGARWTTLEPILLAPPFALFAANLAYAFGTRSAPTVALCALAGLVLGAVVNRAASWRQFGTLAASLAIVATLWRVAGSERRADAATPSVLLIVLDTTAVSHLSAYGYERPTSPRLAALARRALVYRRTVASAPWTLPSHASIFTGRYPSELGFDGLHIERSLIPGSIASDLASTGRETTAISANPIIPAVGALRTGFGKVFGVDALSRPLAMKALDRLRNRQGFQSHGERVTDLALDWLDRVSTRRQPWFLFINYLDPHAPYRPPADEGAAFASGVDPRTVAYDMEMYNSGRLALTSEVRAAMQGLYDGEVAALDRALGRLFDGLDARGYDAANLLLVITADHGESLGESGFVGHLLGMPDRVLRVPLLLMGPGVAPGEVTEPTQLVQVRATLRALVGLDALPEIAAALPPWGAAPALLITEHPEPRWYLDELHGFNAALDPTPWQGNWVAVERAGMKVVFDEGGRGATYDLRSDPEERNPQPLSDGAELVAAYRQWRADRPNPTPRGLNDETRKALEAIGYLH